MGNSGPSSKGIIRGQVSRGKEAIRRGDVAVQTPEKEEGPQCSETASKCLFYFLY